MQVTYSHNPDYQFPHWMDQMIKFNEDNLNFYMDINEWCGQQFGDLGTVWGYDRSNLVQQHPQGLNPVKVKLFYTFLNYSWRFKNKSDAMAFKLRWGGA